MDCSTQMMQLLRKKLSGAPSQCMRGRHWHDDPSYTTVAALWGLYGLFIGCILIFCHLSSETEIWATRVAEAKSGVV